VVMFWVSVLAISILLYILLDGFDLGIGILFGLTGSEERRRAMMSAVAPIWDGNETWLVVAGVVLWGAFPARRCTFSPALTHRLAAAVSGRRWCSAGFNGCVWKWSSRSATRSGPQTVSSDTWSTWASAKISRRLR
jgi:hypothetical protein